MSAADIVTRTWLSSRHAAAGHRTVRGERAVWRRRGCGSVFCIHRLVSGQSGCWFRGHVMVFWLEKIKIHNEGWGEDRRRVTNPINPSLILPCSAVPSIMHLTLTQLTRVSSLELQTINQWSCTITERAFSRLKAATTAFTFKTLLRHYAKQALTPQ